MSLCLFYSHLTDPFSLIITLYHPCRYIFTFKRQANISFFEVFSCKLWSSPNALSNISVFALKCKEPPLKHTSSRVYTAHICFIWPQMSLITLVLGNDILWNQLHRIKIWVSHFVMRSFKIILKANSFYTPNQAQYFLNNMHATQALPPPQIMQNLWEVWWHVSPFTYMV